MDSRTLAVQAALERGDGAEIDALLDWNEPRLPVDVLNRLLVMPGHQQHQLVARALQSLRDPSTVPFACSVLDNGFGPLAYTCSEDETIAKWFSWLLHDIGTPEAIAAIKRYARSSNAGIAAEMQYRLARMRG